MLQRLATAFAAGSLRWQVQPAFAAASRPLWAQSRRSKVTTGIVGLDVDPEARAHLIEKTNEVLKAAKSLPADAVYRQNVDATFGYWLNALKSDQTDEEIEEHFNLQLEQMIELTKDELGLIPKMQEWKPWEVPEGHMVEAIEEREVREILDAAK